MTTRFVTSVGITEEAPATPNPGTFEDATGCARSRRMRAFCPMRPDTTRINRSPNLASGRRLKALAGLVALVLFVGLFPAACDEDNPPLLGVGGGGGGSGSQDSLISSFAILSGDEQTGSTLETFREPLRILATNGRGFGVPDVAVSWELTRGVATLSATSDLTDSTGVSEILISAGSVLGPIEVQAYLDGSSVYGSEFDLLVTAVQIQILSDRFVGPLGSDTVDVVAGDTVEWLNRDVQSHLLRSVETPDGGAVIRSDTLRNSDRYRFVPNGPGTWVYEDQISSSVTASRGVIRVVGRQDVGSLAVELVLAAGNPPSRAVSVTVDGGLFASSIKPGETIVFPDVSAIPHVVRLRDVPLNCVVAGDNPRSVTVVASDTVSTRFELGCQ
jgi:plastocyanin